MSSLSGFVMNFDDVLAHIGGFSRFQWVTLTLIGLAGMPFSMHTMAIVFMGAFPDHWCHLSGLQNTNLTVKDMMQIAIPLDDSGSYSSCYEYDPKYYMNSSAEELANLLSNNERNWTKTVKCSSWDFDQSQFTSTIVSKVSQSELNICPC